MARNFLSRLFSADDSVATMAAGNGRPSSNGAGSKAAQLLVQAKSAVHADFVMNNGEVTYLTGSVPGDVETVRRATAYTAAAYLYVAIRYRAEKVAEPPLRVMEMSDEGWVPVESHPLAELLEDPSPDYDMGELIELTQTYWDIGGDALWAKDLNGFRQVGRLTPFRAEEYKVRQTGDRIMGRFEVDTAGQSAKPFAPEDVVYFRYPNPNDRQRGVSPTDVALSMLNLGKRTEATVRSLLSNAVFPSVVISPHHEWSPEEDELEEFKDLIRRYHEGPKNTGKPFIALGGAKVDRVSLSIQELLPDALIDRVEAVTSSIFRIPPIVLGHLVGLKNSPWSQMEQAHRQAYADAIQPQWRRIEKTLTRQVLRPVDSDRGRKIQFDVTEVQALQDDESQKIKDAAVARFWTLNQRLVHSGQDPLPENDPRGDWIEALARTTAPGLGPSGDAPEPDDEAGKARGRWGRPPKLAGDTYDRSWRWARWDLMCKAQESSWETEVRKGLTADLDAVLEATETEDFRTAWQHALDVPKADRDELETKTPPTGDPEEIAALIAVLAKQLDMDSWHDRVEPLIGSTARTALKDLSADIGIAFDLLEPSLLEYTRDEAGWLIGKIDETTRNQIAAELKASIAEGRTIDEFAKTLRESWGFSDARSQLIARTETTRVSTGAQEKSMEDYQLSTPSTVVEKSWLSSRDTRVRVEHRNLDNGSWIGVNEAFPNGLKSPGEPGCRCGVLYRILEA